MRCISKRRAVLFTLILAAGCALAAGNSEHGEMLYIEHGCYSCHGYNGIGRRQLANDVSPFMQSEAVFTSYLRLRANLEPDGPSNRMPNYSAEVLNDSDTSDLFAYISSLTDEPPALEDIPVMMEILDSVQSGSERD